MFSSNYKLQTSNNNPKHDAFVPFVFFVVTNRDQPGSIEIIARAESAGFPQAQDRGEDEDRKGHEEQARPALPERVDDGGADDGQDGEEQQLGSTREVLEHDSEPHAQ
jgi:hypothetical protein